MGATRVSQHGGLLILLAAFLALGLLYSWATPVLEVLDEIWHYPVVRSLSQGGGLPVQRPGQTTDWVQEGSQPPLYYAVMAGLTGWIDTGDYAQTRQLNPHAKVGLPGEPDNKNMIVHFPEREAFPWQGTVLAVNLIRLASILFAAIGICFTYFSTLLVFPGKRSLALTAAAVHAFNPMFLSVSASVNNDNLATAASSASLYLTLRWLRPMAPVRWRDCLLLGSVLAAGALSKLSGLTILPIVGAAVCLNAWRSHDWRRLWQGGVGIGTPLVLLAGWWFVRNWQLYGEPTGTAMMAAVAGPRPSGFGLADLPAEWGSFWMSYWGVFGAFNVLASPWVYDFFAAMVVVAAVGLVVYVLERLRRGSGPGWPVGLLALWLLVTFAGVVRWTTMTMASQGRLLFSATSAASILLALGLAMLAGAASRVLWRSPHEAGAGNRLAGAGAATLAVGMAVVAATVPIANIHPVYVPGPQREAGTVVVPNPTDIVFGGKLALIGYELDRAAVAVGDRVRVTLYWRCLAPLDGDFSFYAHVVDGGPEEKLGQQDSYPDAGRLSTRQLQPGKVLVDWREIPVMRAPANTPSADVMVGLYDVGTGARLPATDSHGAAVDGRALTSLRVIVPPGLPKTATVQQATFSDILALEGYELAPATLHASQPAKIRLYWHALGRIDKDYTVFVHLTGPSGKPLAQNDHQPQGGHHPTSQWTAGEWVADGFNLELGTGLAPGSYELRIGLYDLKTMDRLSAVQAGGGKADFVTIPV